MIIVLLLMFAYMIIRDIVISKKRRSNKILLKRISSKFDRLEKEAKIQSFKFNQLLDVLVRFEDKDEL